MTVKHILDRKGRDVMTIQASDTIATAAKILCERKIGALVTVGEGGGVIGIISERDIVWLVVAEGAEGLEKPVSSIMSTEVTTAHESMTIDEAMEIMTRQRFRHLPVCEDDRLVGIVSIGDVVKSRIEEVEREADYMRNYIHTG